MFEFTNIIMNNHVHTREQPAIGCNGECVRSHGYGGHCYPAAVETQAQRETALLTAIGHDYSFTDRMNPIQNNVRMLFILHMS